jgi:hypothetical protein
MAEGHPPSEKIDVFFVLALTSGFQVKGYCNAKGSQFLRICLQFVLLINMPLKDDTAEQRGNGVDRELGA